MKTTHGPNSDSMCGSPDLNSSKQMTCKEKVSEPCHYPPSPITDLLRRNVSMPLVKIFMYDGTSQIGRDRILDTFAFYMLFPFYLKSHYRIFCRDYFEINKQVPLSFRHLITHTTLDNLLVISRKPRCFCIHHVLCLLPVVRWA